ncbi:MAG: amidohydrolase, partial [Betaproteobacteria bacterium]
MRRDFLVRAGACAASIGFGRRARAQSSDSLELVIKGGTIVDPASGIRARADIGLRAGRIAALEPEIAASRAARVIDAGGKLVTPGLIDLHAKVYGEPGGDTPGQLGVTTCVSAGEASAHGLAAFRRHAAGH